jgi:hypothetical protein
MVSVFGDFSYLGLVKTGIGDMETNPVHYQQR